MSEKMTKKRTKVKDNPKSELADKLNQVPSEETSANIQKSTAQTATQSEEEIKAANEKYYNELFDRWDEQEFQPLDFGTPIPVDSMESSVGYSSLFRQMHQSFIRTVAFYRSEAGGSLTIDEARKAAFHACNNREEAQKIFSSLMSLPLESLNFVDLMKLQSFSPRAAESFWEMAKMQGRAEFESGHLAANITFPVGYMKQLWNIARYLGVRESFISDWQPEGGIEVALIDMMAQTYFQWQYWIEQTVKRSETRETEVHPEYKRWLAERGRELKSYGITDGYWNRPYVTEQQALEHAVQMADRFNRIFMRTLRQLRDLRRYSPVTINNPNQVNIAADGGQQVNVSNADEETMKKVTS
jgi:hypothetical protein